MSTVHNAGWLPLIRSKKRLDREKGISQLELMLNQSISDIQSEDKNEIESELLRLVLSLTSPWEERHGGLLASGIMIHSGTASQQFCDRIKGEIPLFLEDSESRVRMAAGTKVRLKSQPGIPLHAHYIK